MKKILLYVVVLAGLLILPAGCQTDIEKYDYDRDGLNFKDSLINYSFAYTEPGTEVYTIWLEVTTQGFVPGYSRRVQLEQINLPDVVNAVPGRDYVDFTDFSDDFIASNYIIPANTAQWKIPLKVIRHQLLETEEVSLGIRVKPDGEYFGIGLVPRSTVIVTITDMLTRPKHWVGYYDVSSGNSVYFGEYSPEKHRWMIESTGEKWDAEYLYDVVGFDEDNDDYSNRYLNDNFDRGFYDYLERKLQKKLEEDNAKLIAEEKQPYDFVI